MRPAFVPRNLGLTYEAAPFLRPRVPVIIDDPATLVFWTQPLLRDFPSAGNVHKVYSHLQGPRPEIMNVAYGTWKNDRSYGTWRNDRSNLLWR